MLGSACLGVALRPTRRRSHPVGRADVYDVASQLGVLPDQLPCAIFFTGGADSHAPVILDFARFLPSDQDRRKEDITQAFRSIAASLRRHSGEPERKRLAKLDRSLRQARKGCFDGRVTRQPSAISRAVGASVATIHAMATGEEAYMLASMAVALIGGGHIHFG